MVTRQTVPRYNSPIGDAVNAFDNLADTIANPPVDKPLRGAIGRAGQQYCNYLGSVPATASGLLGPGFVVGSLLCTPYWNKNNYSAPVPGGGVVGGQCNVTYQFQAQRRAAGAVFSTVQLTSRVGPITGITKVPNGAGSFNDRYVITGPNVVGANIDITYSSGGQTRLLGPFISGTSNPDFTCGDGPGTGFSPGQNPPPNPGGWPSGFEPGVDDDDNPYFTVPPIDNPVDPTNPVDLPDDPATQPTGGAPAGPPEPGTPVATGEGGEEEGEAPPDKELYGLRIDITTVPSYAREYSPGVYRAVCYVYMGGDEGLDHDPAGAMMESGQFVLAEREGLTKWRVAANLGFNLTVTPYYRTPKES